MRRRFTLFTAVLAPFIFAACGGGGPALPPPPTPMPPPVPLYQDNGGGIRDSTRIVIRDAGTLEEYWSRATSPQSSPPPVPVVDFDRQMIILVALGRATPEEEIHVDSLLVRRELNAAGDRVETLAIVVRTVHGCGRFRTEAFPLEIVRARTFDGPIRWEERRQQTVCGEAPESMKAAVSPEIRAVTVTVSQRSRL
jgi:predicted small lipoprotein YifL